MTLGGSETPPRGLARFAGVRSSRELRCRARRRQTSVRATRLRFYATTSASSTWFLTALSRSLFSISPSPPSARSPAHPSVRHPRPLSFCSSSPIASFLPELLTFLSYPPRTGDISNNALPYSDSISEELAEIRQKLSKPHTFKTEIFFRIFRIISTQIFSISICQNSLMYLLRLISRCCDLKNLT